MFKFFVPVLLVVFSVVTPASSLPTPSFRVFARDSCDNSTLPTLSDNSTLPASSDSSTLPTLNDTATRFPDLALLASGNQAFRLAVANSSNPDLLKDLATNGQQPEYLFLGCRFVKILHLLSFLTHPSEFYSDSRVSEGTIFSAPPDTLFSQRNIANQFQLTDNNAVSVLSYGVQSLNVGHVIVMGHYGCSGVLAAMSPWPNTDNDTMACSVQSWVDPIRQTLANSSR